MSDALKLADKIAFIAFGSPSIQEAAAELRRLHAEVESLRAELERERMRLAACGVVALSNTPDTATQARQMHGDYWSGSLEDVIRIVDQNIALRADAARYRWLRSGKYLSPEQWCELQDTTEAELDAAIDYAIAKAEEA